MRLKKALALCLILSCFTFLPSVVSAENAQLENAITGSDDYSKHREIFLKASAHLLENGTCTLADFEEMGGWVKSQNHKSQPIYFTYCGGMTIQNRIYLNTSNGETFK